MLPRYTESIPYAVTELTKREKHNLDFAIKSCEKTTKPAPKIDEIRKMCNLSRIKGQIGSIINKPRPIVNVRSLFIAI